MLQHLGQSAHGDEAHLLLDLGVHLIQVAGVVPGDEHRRDALTEGRHALFLQTADGQHVAVQRDFSGHGQVVVDRDTGQRRNQRRRQCDTRGGTVLRHSALGGMDVQVGVLELVGRDAVFFGVDLGVGHGELGALLHDITEAAGDLDFAGAVRDDGDLNRQHLAADTRPRQTVGNAHGVLAGDKRRLDLLGAEQLLDHRCGNADLLGFPCRDLLRTFAQHRRDGAFQIAHACLAGVAVNDGIQCAACQGHAPLQAVVFQLLGQQMALGDVEFFGAGVAGQLDDIHAVIERAGDRGGIVRRRDKEHLAQIKRNIEVVILKGAVLLGVQHLEQCAGRVSLVVARQLVDLVEQDDRVRGLGRRDGADDAARHRADVGAAVAADLGFIVDAAQAHAGKFAVHALGNGVRNARFADARRADKADDLPLDVLVQLAHSQQLENAFLDLLQAVVLTVQHLAGVGLVKVVLGGGVPRQGQAGIQIAADNAALGAAALHTGQTVTLFQQLFGGFFIKVQCLDFPAVCIGLGAGVLGVAELLADDIHLLAQVVFALALVHAGVDLVVQVALDVHDLAFLPQQGQQLFEAAQQGRFVQDNLLILILEQEVGGHVLAQIQRRIGGNDVIDDILGNLRAVGQVLLKAVLQAADESLDLVALVGRDAAHRHGAYRGLQILFADVELQQTGTGLALDEDLHEVIGDAQHLLDFGNDTVGIQVAKGRFFLIHLALGDEKDAAVGVHGGLDGGNGLGAAHLKMDYIVGENHQPAQGDGRQMHHIAGDLDLYFFRHSYSPIACRTGVLFAFAASSGGSRMRAALCAISACIRSWGEHSPSSVVMSGLPSSTSMSMLPVRKNVMYGANFSVTVSSPERCSPFL